MTRINVEFINVSADTATPLDFNMLGKIPACILQLERYCCYNRFVSLLMRSFRVLM